jgi:hypothetical protein
MAQSALIANKYTIRFGFERVVTNFSEDYFRDQLFKKIRSTGYRGRLLLWFPIHANKVDFYNSNRLQWSRTNRAVRVIFCMTFLWIVTWPYLFFSTKRWAVVRAEWPFYRIEDDGRKVYTSISEQEWIETMGPKVRRLAISRRFGTWTERGLKRLEDWHAHREGYWIWGHDVRLKKS